MNELLERLEDCCRVRMRSCSSRPLSWLWSEAYFGVRWIAAWRASHREIPGEPLPRIHTRETYHIRGTQPGECYPLTVSEILRLLHTARYGDLATRNSIQVRLHQAMLPDRQVRDVDLERCALDDKYLEWSQSGNRPTPALAQEFSSLLQRKSRSTADV